MVGAAILWDPVVTYLAEVDPTPALAQMCHPFLVELIYLLKLVAYQCNTVKLPEEAGC